MHNIDRRIKGVSMKLSARNILKGTVLYQLTKELWLLKYRLISEIKTRLRQLSLSVRLIGSSWWLARKCQSSLKRQMLFWESKELLFPIFHFGGHFSKERPRFERLRLRVQQ